MIADAVYLLFAALNYAEAASRSMIVPRTLYPWPASTRQLRIESAVGGESNAAPPRRSRTVDGSGSYPW